MTEKIKYECDYGEGLYEKEDVLEIELRFRRHSPFEIGKRNVHIAEHVLENEVDGMIPNNIDYIGVEDGKVVGGVFPYYFGGKKRGVWKERDNVTIDHYEDFFKFLDREILSG